MEWVIVGGVALVVVVVVVFLATRKKEQGMPAFAARMGLAYQNGVVTGMIQGFTVTVEERVPNRPRASSRTVFTIQFPQRLNLGLQVVPLQEKPRSQRMLETGDPGFDQVVGVEAREQARASELLDEERRNCIRELFEGYPEAWIDDEGLRWTAEGRVEEYATFKRIVDDLLDCAVAVFPGRAARRSARMAEKARSA